MEVQRKSGDNDWCLPGPETGEGTMDPWIHLTTISGGSFMFRGLKIMRISRCKNEGAFCSILVRRVLIGGST